MRGLRCAENGHALLDCHRAEDVGALFAAPPRGQSLALHARHHLRWTMAWTNAWDGWKKGGRDWSSGWCVCRKLQILAKVGTEKGMCTSQLGLCGFAASALVLATAFAFSASCSAVIGSPLVRSIAS